MMIDFKEQLSKIELLKKQLVQQIYDRSDLSKVEKLELLDEINICRKHSYILMPSEGLFLDHAIKFREQLKKKHHEKNSGFSIDEEWHNDMQRHEIINFVYMLEDIDEDEDYLFFTVRGYDDKYYITGKEIIDIVYEYAFKNLVIGYKLDW